MVVRLGPRVLIVLLLALFGVSQNLTRNTTGRFHLKPLASHQGPRYVNSTSNRWRGSPLSGTEGHHVSQHVNTTSRNYANSNTTSILATNSCSILPPPQLGFARGDGRNTSIEPFPFYIPFQNTQTCDIYGALCQTGSITLNVSLSGCLSSTTTMPCSSYLTKQRSYITDIKSAAYYARLGYTGMASSYFDIMDEGVTKYQVGFARDPKCYSFMSVYSQASQSSATYTFSRCPANKSFLPATSAWKLPWEMPRGTYDPDIQDGLQVALDSCCGSCLARVDSVDIYYFPDPGAESYCRANGRRAGFVGYANSSTKLPGYDVLKHAMTAAPQGRKSFAYIGNHTLYVPWKITSRADANEQLRTSPSVYLQMQGIMTVQDFCGIIGEAFTSPLLSFAPGDVSTVVLKTWGSDQLDVIFSKVKPLTLADLECPTLGVGQSWIDKSMGIQSLTVGRPWLPIIPPFSQIFSYNSAWQKSCTRLMSYGYLDFNAMFDPPRALVPVEGLAEPESGIKPADQPSVSITASSPSSTAKLEPSQSVVAGDPAITLPAPNIFAEWAESIVGGLDPGSIQTLQDNTPQLSGHVFEKQSDTRVNDFDTNRPATFISNPPENAFHGMAKPDPNDPGLDLQHAKNTGIDPAAQPTSDDKVPQVAAVKDPGSKLAEDPEVSPTSQIDNQAKFQDAFGWNSAGNPFDPNQFQPGAGGVKEPESKLAEAPEISPTSQVNNSDKFRNAFGWNEAERPSGPDQPQPGANVDQFPPNDLSTAVPGQQPTQTPLPNISGPQNLDVPEIHGTSNEDKYDGAFGWNRHEVDPQPVVPGQTNRAEADFSQTPDKAKAKMPPLSNSDPSFIPVNPERSGSSSGGNVAAFDSVFRGIAHDANSVSGQPPHLNHAQGYSSQANNPMPIDSVNPPMNDAASFFRAPDPPPQGRLVTIAGETVSARPDGFVADGQTIKPGSPAVNIAGTPVSLSPSETLHIGKNEIALDPPAATPGLFGSPETPPKIALDPLGRFRPANSIPAQADTIPSPTPARHVFAVAGTTFTALSSGSAVAVSDITLSAGQPAATLNGTPLSLAPNGILHVGSTAIPIPTPAPAAANIFSISSGLNFTVLSSGSAVAVNGTTLTVGGPPFTVDGTSLSLGTDGMLIAGSTTIPVPTVSAGAGDIFSVDGLTFTEQASGSAIIISGKTLTAGMPEQTIHGTPISFDTKGTLTVHSTAFAVPTAVPLNPSFPAGGLVFTPLNDGAGVVANGTTITKGMPAVTVDGKSVSFNGRGMLVINGTSVAVPTEVRVVESTTTTTGLSDGVNGGGGPQSDVLPSASQTGKRKHNDGCGSHSSRLWLFGWQSWSIMMVTFYLMMR